MERKCGNTMNRDETELVDKHTPGSIVFMSPWFGVLVKS